MSTTILLDTNAYLRLAKRIQPLLGKKFNPAKDYVLVVLREVEDEVELDGSERRIGDREVPVRERRDGKRLRVRDRDGDVVPALRTGGRAPADARRGDPVGDDGVARLTAGDVVQCVMPVRDRGGERQLTLGRSDPG